MENLSGKTEREIERTDGEHSPRVPVCPACGARAHRREARFCATCGREFQTESYLPADALRASYHLQYQSRTVRPEAEANEEQSVHQSGGSVQPELAMFPIENRNGASTTALAFATYALVPYLGILFCPGALVLGSIGLFYSFYAPQRGGRRASAWSIAIALLILCAQIFLWWILYQVPRWAGRF